MVCSEFNHFCEFNAISVTINGHRSLSVLICVQESKHEIKWVEVTVTVKVTEVTGAVIVKLMNISHVHPRVRLNQLTGICYS